MVGSQVNSSAAGSRFTYDARRFCSAMASMRAVQNVVYTVLEYELELRITFPAPAGPMTRTATFGIA